MNNDYQHVCYYMILFSSLHHDYMIQLVGARIKREHPDFGPSDHQFHPSNPPKVSILSPSFLINVPRGFFAAPKAEQLPGCSEVLLF